MARWGAGQKVKIEFFRLMRISAPANDRYDGSFMWKMMLRVLAAMGNETGFQTPKLDTRAAV